jgi:preprotein translocase subunit SecA
MSRLMTDSDTGHRLPHWPRPGPLFGPYPQRSPPPPGSTAWAWQAGRALLAGGPTARRQRHFEQLLAQAVSAGGGTTSTTVLADLRARLSRHGPVDALLAQALAQVALAVQQQHGFAVHRAQPLAAWAMLDGCVVEMDTGEGKSVALLLAAAVAALAGVPVQVVSANDHLAERDAAAARPVLARLGLRADCVQPGDAARSRRRAYAAEVCWASARELGFDALRDRLADAGERVLPGLCLALVDEADAVLIDHAQQPLVLARPRPAAFNAPALGAVWAHSAQLVPGRDFQLDALHRNAVLTACTPMPALPSDVAPDDTAAWLRQALVVRHLLQRDRDYLVEAGADGQRQVVLIDAATGRAAPGTQWQRALQPLVALKEHCPAPQATEAVAQASLQSLLAGWWRLGGTSGTVGEARLELALAYGLRSWRVPPQRPSRRQDRGLRVLPSVAAHLAAVHEVVRRCAAAGQPLLVATPSVAANQRLAEALRAAGHRLQTLDARDARPGSPHETEVLACAGLPGALTVATSVAARGADIRPSPQALAAGGLHVLSTAPMPLARLERQLAGRAARQGEPGSVERLWFVNDLLQTRRPDRGQPGAALWPASWLHRCPPAAWRAVVGLGRGLRALHSSFLRAQQLADEVRTRRTLAWAAPPIGRHATPADPLP